MIKWLAAVVLCCAIPARANARFSLDFHQISSVVSFDSCSIMGATFGVKHPSVWRGAVFDPCPNKNFNFTTDNSIHDITKVCQFLRRPLGIRADNGHLVWWHFGKNSKSDGGLGVSNYSYATSVYVERWTSPKVFYRDAHYNCSFWLTSDLGHDVHFLNDRASKKEPWPFDFDQRPFGDIGTLEGCFGCAVRFAGHDLGLFSGNPRVMERPHNGDERGSGSYEHPEGPKRHAFLSVKIAAFLAPLMAFFVLLDRAYGESGIRKVAARGRYAFFAYLSLTVSFVVFGYTLLSF